MRYLKTLVLASLLSFGASAAMAAGGGISTGLSGSSAGMISEGGKSAFNLDAKESAGNKAREPDARSRRGADSYAKADDDDGRSKVKTKSKKKKKTYAKSWGFTSFGYSGQTRKRYRTLTDD